MRYYDRDYKNQQRVDFSDVNNLTVVTTTSEKYSGYFGFAAEEVFTAFKEYSLSSKGQRVKKWYDGFSYGSRTVIYNPWSIINFLDEGKVGLYWGNTSSNSLVGKLIREGDLEVKKTFKQLTAAI